MQPERPWDQKNKLSRTRGGNLSLPFRFTELFGCTPAESPLFRLGRLLHQTRDAAPDAELASATTITKGGHVIALQNPLHELIR